MWKFIDWTYRFEAYKWEVSMDNKNITGIVLDQDMSVTDSDNSSIDVDMSDSVYFSEP
jgi:hypothetical protein